MRSIRELRASTKESQAEVARAIGCPAAQVAAWESGAAPLPEHRRLALAEHFGVDPAEIDAQRGQRAEAAAEIARLKAEVVMLRARLDELEAERARRRKRRDTA